MRVESSGRHSGLCGELLDIYDDRFGYPEVWRVRLLIGEIIMEQADRLRKVAPAQLGIHVNTRDCEPMGPEAAKAMVEAAEALQRAYAKKS